MMKLPQFSILAMLVVVFLAAFCFWAWNAHGLLGTILVTPLVALCWSYQRSGEFRETPLRRQASRLALAASLAVIVVFWVAGMGLVVGYMLPVGLIRNHLDLSVILFSAFFCVTCFLITTHVASTVFKR